MKYGETLRQRSIPAWSHHNIDYDDIKHFIKEHTTPGKGKAITVPGKVDDQLLELENSLFHILADQHQRIDLFVKSKSGEIRRRLDHSKKQLRQLALRRSDTIDTRVPVTRLERYCKLENDVIKAGEEIKSLARFTATQRTAFRKLLKKYKKWTGSAELEDRFRDEVLEDPKGFTRLDLGPLLDEYSATQHTIRSLYEDQLRRSTNLDGSKSPGAPRAPSSTIKQLSDALDTDSMVSFDASMETTPLGKHGTFASYFVHPENVVELQMLLLQYARFQYSRSRTNSIATPVTSDPHATNFTSSASEDAEYHVLVADKLERIAEELSALTVDDREHVPGIPSQRAKVSVRWNDNEDALASLRSQSGKTKTAFLKKKHIIDFFDESADFSPKSIQNAVESVENVEALRKELLKDDIKPLFKYSSCRSRLSGLDNSTECLAMVTLDTGISIQKAGAGHPVRSMFPFALLLIRQEGLPKTDLISIIDNCHLVERVRGFSIEYHSVWQTHQPTSIPAPFWLPMLSQDIRKLPPPAALKRTGSPSITASGTQTATSNESVTGGAGSTTAVEQESPLQLENPPLKSFRKKKRRKTYAEEAIQEQQRYWSEYDHPEDGGTGEDAYVIYIDPNEKGILDNFFEKLTLLFRRKGVGKDAYLSMPGSPGDDEVSSDDEEAALLNVKNGNGFGTFAQPTSAWHDCFTSSPEHAGLSHFSGVCFAASLSILVVAYLLHSTGKKKLHREVHYGVFFATICSLAFMLVGFMSVLRTPRSVSFVAWIVSIAVLLIDVVGSGGLIASLLA